MNTLNQRMQIDAAEHQIRQIIDRIYHHLSDHIARANKREVLEFLYKFYTESDMVLISKSQLRVYQELERLNLSLAELDLNSKPPLYACGCGLLHPKGFKCLSVNNETT